MTKKTYSVIAHYKNWFHCEVEAENEEEARKIALTNTDWVHLQEEESKVPTIEEVEEV
jgi:hypothetical protein